MRNQPQPDIGFWAPPGSPIAALATMGNQLQPDIGLLVRAKPFLRRPFTDWSGPVNLVIDRGDVDIRIWPQDIEPGKRIADALQRLLNTQSYPDDREHIIAYAKGHLHGVTEDKQRLFIEFLVNWIQRTEVIYRSAARVDEEPLNPNAHFELAEAMLRQLGQEDDAEEYFVKALALKPVDFLLVGRSNRRLGEIARNRSNWDMARYRYQQSIEALEDYLRRSADDSEAWNILALAYDNLSSVYDSLGKSQAAAAADAKAQEAAARAELLSLASAREGAREILPLDKDKTGLAFEEKCHRLIRAMGFHAETTKRTGDGGIDIIATSTQPLLRGQYVIQCKDWSNPVGEPPLRDLYGVVVSMRANKGILITSSTFTKAAQLFAQDKQLELIDGEQLDKLYRKHVEGSS
jgi:tetratricopeptide (TPR) repeat protein